MIDLRQPLLLLVTLMAFTAQAADVTFSDVFSGDEGSATAWEGACAGATALSWQSAGPFRVSGAGDYAFADAGELLATDIQIGIYAGSFQSNNPSANRLARIDGGGLVALSAGQDYSLVVQRQCDGSPGTWAVSVSGPGEITSTAASTAPAWTAGSISADGPQADFGEGLTPYRDAGTLRVSQAGFYGLADVSVFTGLDAVAHIYDRSFQPGNPAANRIARIDDAGGAWLTAGVDYRVIVSGFVPGDSGAFRLVQFPPGDMEINEGLNGAWYEPATSGQGILLEVYPDAGVVFLAWFTFDAQQPFDPGSAALGDASQRWLTAAGPFQPGMNQVNMTVSNTSGGLFDQSAQGQSQDNGYGTISLTFETCDRATLEYNLPDAGVSGVIPLSRVVRDNTPLCGALLSSPGVITD